MEQEFREVYNRFKMHFYRHIFGEAAADAELSVMEALAAEVIYALGRPTVSQFAAAVGISGPNATYRIQSLVRKGYISREYSSEDRRECRLSVTDKFLKAYAINEEYISVLSQRISERFTPEETALFEKIMVTMSKELMPEATIK